MNQLINLENTLGVKFKDQSRLHQALIHRSYLNENRSQKLTSNERYEFLGDAILEFWISDILFRSFPAYPEGDLTNLRSLIVCTQNLAKIASSIHLGDYLCLSKGEEANGGRHNPSILADTFESLLGAVYLDQGTKVAFSFLEKHLRQSIDEISSQKNLKDPKSFFQEIAQSQRGITPVYRTISESGPDHHKTFESGVFLGDELITKGIGPSKQRAEEAAALAATEIFSQKQ